MNWCTVCRSSIDTSTDYHLRLFHPYIAYMPTIYFVNKLYELKADCDDIYKLKADNIYLDGRLDYEGRSSSFSENEKA